MIVENLIVFLLIRFANQLEVPNEICLFGMIDAAMAVQDELLLLKGSNFYLYKVLEGLDDFSAELPQRINNEEYELLLERLKAESDPRLEFKYKCSFVEMCSMQFEQFESAVYFEPDTLHLVVRGRRRVIKLQWFRWGVSDCEDWSVRCSQENYEEFVQSNQLVYNFDQVVDIGRGERLVFRGDAFYLTTNESNPNQKKPRTNLRTNGPFAIQTLGANVPRATQGIVRIRDQLWLFDRSQVAKMTLRQLNDRLQVIRQSKSNANFEFLCEYRGLSKRRTGRIKAKMNIYEILLLKLNKKSIFVEDGGFQMISVVSVLACTSTGVDYVIDQIDPLDYLHCHPALYLLLALVLFGWLASLFALASLFILSKVLKKKRRQKKQTKKFNFFLLQELELTEITKRRGGYRQDDELVTRF